MNSLPFWLGLSLAFLILALVAFNERRKLKRKLSKLEEVSPSGFIVNGKSVSIETEMYRALLTIFVTDIVACVLAAIGAIFTVFFP